MNLIFIFSIIEFFNYFCCDAFPECCFAPTEYSDILKIVKCKLSCMSPSEENNKFCSTCISSNFGEKNIIHTLSDFNFSQPQIICQDFIKHNEKIYGQLILVWNFKSSLLILPVFLIEFRSISKNREWNFVGMTNETVAKIRNLEIGEQYQFRVTPIVVSTVTLNGLMSDWILIPNKETNISAPTNINATSFEYQENLIFATINWEPSKEIPCSYQLYWLSSLGGDYFEQKKITLPKDKLSVILPRLSFETNYTIKISPFEESGLRKVKSALGWFVTPSCLTVTNGNFTLCPPGPPLNITVLWSHSVMDAVLKWKPPFYSSSNNEINNYYLTIAEVPEQLNSEMQFQDHVQLDKNSTFFKVSNLRRPALYIFKIRATSSGGTGLPAVMELSTKDIELKKDNSPSEIPWHYIIPSLIFFLVILLVAILYWLAQARRRGMDMGYPNGMADVPNHLLPFLVPSQKIQLNEVLGQGAFGVVYEGVFLHKVFKEKVAVKTFPAESFSRHMLIKEVDLLQMIGRHDHIVSLIGFTLNIDKMFLLLEFCALGDLHSYLPSLKKVLLEVRDQRMVDTSISIDPKHGIRMCNYIYQVAVGMEYISSLKLIHRDLAARNILMCNEDHVKIADFGLSKDVYETQKYYSTSEMKLPIKWMAPESLERQKFSTRTDVWSFGVFMWEVFKFGQEPYLGYQNSQILNLLKNGKRLTKPGTCSHEWYEIMLKCWQLEARSRPTFKELKEKTGSIVASMCNYTIVVNL